MVRMVDSARRDRRRKILGLTLIALGVLLVAAGLAARQVAPPPLTQVTADGTTEVPRTWFFQEPWVLFADVSDPRRPPALSEIGCRPGGDLSVPRQPTDLTRFGSRVIDDRPLSAVALLSRSGGSAALQCTGAQRFAPLWLAPASPAPPLTPTAIVVAGFLALVAGGLVHPSTANFHLGRRRGNRTSSGRPAPPRDDADPALRPRR